MVVHLLAGARSYPSPMSAAPASSRRKIFRDGVLLLVLAALPALLTGWLHPKRPVWSWNKPSVTEVELCDVARWSPPVLWIDARTADAFHTQHVPGAILLNEQSWDQLFPGFLDGWQPSAKIVVYCDSSSCDASQAVALRLQHDLNQTDIYVLKGGWATWLKTQK